MMQKIYKNEDGSLSVDGSVWEDTSVPEDSPERFKPCVNTYADYFAMRNEAVSQGKTIREGKDEQGEYYYIGEPEPILEPTEAELLAQRKAERADAVSKIIVEVDGMKFDGDEKSQERMNRAIVVLVGDEKMPWVLADNSVVEVNQTILKKALRLAGQKQADLWTKPYLEVKK